MGGVGGAGAGTVGAGLAGVGGRVAGQRLDRAVGVVDRSRALDVVQVDPSLGAVELQVQLARRVGDAAGRADGRQAAVLHAHGDGVGHVHRDVQVVHHRRHLRRAPAGEEEHQRRRVGNLQVALAAAGALRIAVHVAGADHGVGGGHRRVVRAVVAAVQVQRLRAEGVGHVMNPAEAAAGHHVVHAQAHVDELPRVAHDDLAVAVLGQPDQLAGVGRPQHHRLLQQQVQAALQHGARHLVVGGVPDRDHRAVQLVAVEQVAVVGVGGADAVVVRRLAQHLRPQVGDAHQVGVRVADQRRQVRGRRPPAGADHPDSRLHRSAAWLRAVQVQDRDRAGMIEATSSRRSGSAAGARASPGS